MTEFADGTVQIRTPAATPQVLTEYAEALLQHPKDARLRMYYGLALASAGHLDAAEQELRQSVALDPASALARAFLAGRLKEAGQLEPAVAEYRAALHLLAQEGEDGAGQEEALLRWGLAGALQAQGRGREAHAELEAAVTVQTQAVERGEGSPQLLRQLKSLLSAGDG